MADPQILDRSPAPPPEIARPALAYFLWARDLDWREAGAFLGVSHETARKMCLPFDDPQRVVPKPAARDRIARLTHGWVQPPSFDAPALPWTVKAGREA